ncbi:MAG: VOC family protein [bacterium]|nr:VOC family protein [bacterium]
MLQPFHFAFPVADLAKSRDFYGRVLGCPEGRSSERWIDFDLFGHQIVAHHVGERTAPPPTNAVDGEQVPVPHFGVVLAWEDWERLAARLREHQVAFVIEPTIRFEGEHAEQATMFFLDPSGNALEFKAFKNPSELFEPGAAPK